MKPKYVRNITTKPYIRSSIVGKYHSATYEINPAFFLKLDHSDESHTNPIMIYSLWASFSFSFQVLISFDSLHQFDLIISYFNHIHCWERDHMFSSVHAPIPIHKVHAVYIIPCNSEWNEMYKKNPNDHNTSLKINAFTSYIPISKITLYYITFYNNPTTMYYYLHPLVLLHCLLALSVQRKISFLTTQQTYWLGTSRRSITLDYPLTYTLLICSNTLRDFTVSLFCPSAVMYCLTILRVNHKQKQQQQIDKSRSYTWIIYSDILRDFIV